MGNNLIDFVDITLNFFLCGVKLGNKEKGSKVTIFEIEEEKVTLVLLLVEIIGSLKCPSLAWSNISGGLTGWLPVPFGEKISIKSFLAISCFMRISPELPRENPLDSSSLKVLTGISDLPNALGLSVESSRGRGFGLEVSSKVLFLPAKNLKIDHKSYLKVLGQILGAGYFDIHPQ